MPFCRNCGEQVSDEIVTCLSCGESVYGKASVKSSQTKSCTNCDYPSARICKSTECENRVCNGCTSSLVSSAKELLWPSTKSEFMSLQDPYDIGWKGNRTILKRLAEQEWAKLKEENRWLVASVRGMCTECGSKYLDDQD